MGEFFTALSGGIPVALFNKFVLSGMSGSIFQACATKQDDDDDRLSSQSSTIIADIHVNH